MSPAELKNIQQFYSQIFFGPTAWISLLKGFQNFRNYIVNLRKNPVKAIKTILKFKPFVAFPRLPFPRKSGLIKAESEERMLLMNSESKANRSVIYQMFLRPFTEEGTFSAAAEMLNHVRSLGVDVVYLCPVFYQDDEALPEHWSDRQNKSGLGNPQNPYRIKDYFHVDPEYGSDDDLRAFTEKAHTLGLRVMLDLVYYHCGPTAVFLEKHPDFVKQDENGNIRYGLWHFPELNFENPKLREYLWENMEFFVREYGVDGYRCDVGDSVPLSFWEEGRKRLEALRPDIIMLNEGTNPEYLNAFDVNYDFRWAGMVPSVCAGDASAADLQTYWQEIHDKLPESGLVLRSIDNHDIANDCGSLRIEDRLGSAAVEACLTLNFAMDGVPFL